MWRRLWRRARRLARRSATPEAARLRPHPSSSQTGGGPCGRAWARAGARGGLPRTSRSNPTGVEEGTGNAGAFGGGAGGGVQAVVRGGGFQALLPRARARAGRTRSAPPAPPEEGAARVFEIVASEPKKKGRCAVGCDARWDRWTSTSDAVMKYEKHYCGLCARAYCARHTRVSPHGVKGRCDPESKCYCVTCHATLDRATREALERTNKLPPPSAALAGETSVSRKAKSRWRRVRSNFRLRTGSCENLPLSPVNSSGNLLSPTK